MDILAVAIGVAVTVLIISAACALLTAGLIRTED